MGLEELARTLKEEDQLEKMNGYPGDTQPSAPEYSDIPAEGGDTSELLDPLSRTQIVITQAFISPELSPAPVLTQIEVELSQEPPGPPMVNQSPGPLVGTQSPGPLVVNLPPESSSHPDLTVLPAATKEVLERLADMPEVFVSVITGRCIPDIKAKVNIKNITYAGNHGIDIIHPDGTKFVPPMPEEVEEKASWLLQKLQAECCVDGAWVENKGIVLALHHEAWKEKGSIDPEKKERLLSRARELMTEAGFKIGMSDGGLVTEAKPAIKWDKGNAAIYILRSAFGVNWSENIRIIFAGDDLTDEDAMKALKGLAFNFRVVNSGLVQTLANHRLPDTKGILTMLLWVEKFMLERRSQNKKT